MNFRKLSQVDENRLHSGVDRFYFPVGSWPGLSGPLDGRRVRGAFGHCSSNPGLGRPCVLAGTRRWIAPVNGGGPTKESCAGASCLLARQHLLEHGLNSSPGAIGEALGTAIPNCVFAVITFVLSCRAVHLPVAEMLRYVVPGPLVGGLPALGFLLMAKSLWVMDNYGSLILAGVGTCLIQAVSMSLVFRRDRFIRMPVLAGLLSKGSNML